MWAIKFDITMLNRNVECLESTPDEWSRRRCSVQISRRGSDITRSATSCCKLPQPSANRSHMGSAICSSCYPENEVKFERSI